MRLEVQIPASARKTVHYKSETQEAETEAEEHALQAVAAAEINTGHRDEDFLRSAYMRDKRLDHVCGIGMRCPGRSPRCLGRGSVRILAAVCWEMTSRY
jgi:hypothetical protein